MAKVDMYHYKILWTYTMNNLVQLLLCIEFNCIFSAITVKRLKSLSQKKQQNLNRIFVYPGFAG